MFSGVMSPLLGLLIISLFLLRFLRNRKGLIATSGRNIFFFIPLALRGGSLGMHVTPTGQNPLLLTAILCLLHHAQCAADVVEAQKYSVVFSRESAPTGLNEENYYTMRLSNGSSYTCVLPSVTYDPSRGNREDAVQHVPLSLEDLSEVGRALDGKCYTMEESWWTYRLCWGSKMEQYHLPLAVKMGKKVLADTSKTSYYLLGVAPPSDVLDLRYGVDAKGLWYLYTVYSDGMTCDLTQLPRTTEVRLYCLDEDRDKGLTMRVRETEVCHYVVTLIAKDACVLRLKERVQNYGVISCHKADAMHSVG
uniref:Uncharacterized protein TCIL3000_11_11360 n=1 Tax=Trypanosoma congolense (strain IL3000) TaxID=1068625 RepID=G0V1X6_TRYCI|nr:unnamed protein product [Trypanosoma congolense IL3000]